MHYLYIKRLPSRQSVFLAFLASQVLPPLFVVLGLFLVGSALLPIVSYNLSLSPRFTPLVKPVVEDETFKAEVLAEETSVSLTQPTSWFFKTPTFPPRPSKITHYSLSIPRLEINDAVVQVGGEDLKQSLIHYEGTAYPGQFGNSVVFGHSVLPQFFNPKNYLTIFSTLPTLTKGDEILIEFDGVFYKYLVSELVEVPPTDISVLEQHYDDSYLTLITCVPPGTYLRRLAVKAKLVR